MADGEHQLPAISASANSLSGRSHCAARTRAAEPELVRRHQLVLGLVRAPWPGRSQPRQRRAATAPAGAETYLNPTLKALFPDPSTFTDMDRAAAILVDALETVASRWWCSPTMTWTGPLQRRPAGAAGSGRMGHDLPIYVPDRILEGYGLVAGRLPPPARGRQGAEVVITVDCGAAAHDAIACAAEIGLEVVVIDHHLMREGEIPAIAALVNPNRPDCASGQGHLAAAGVTFVLLAALNREARARALFANRPEPDLRQWLDLAAMGATICDVTSTSPASTGRWPPRG